MGPSTVIGEIPVEGGPLKTAGMPGFRIWNWTATNFLSSRELCLARHILILRLAAKNGNTLTENLSCTYCRHLMVLATARCSVEATTLQLFIILDTASYRRVPNSHRNSSSQQHLVRTLAKLEWTADCFPRFPQLQMALTGTARSYRCRHFCNRFVVPRDYKFSPRLPVCAGAHGEKKIAQVSLGITSEEFMRIMSAGGLKPRGTGCRKNVHCFSWNFRKPMFQFTCD